MNTVIISNTTPFLGENIFRRNKNMSQVKYVDRRNTRSNKWDGQTGMFGEEGLLPLWVADMDFQVPSCVTDALSAYVSQGVFGYYNIPDSYYQAFINWEKQYHSYEVRREWLRFSPGVVSAFNWITQFITKPEDAVIVLTPVYYPFLHAVENNRRRLITSDLVNTSGVYTIDFEDFERKIVENQVTLFILCSPHNPAGRVWTRDELQRLFDICRKHHVFVISDEIHQDLTFAGHVHTPSFRAGSYDDMMITVTAPSKTFNLAACQNSVIIIPDEALRSKWDKYVLGLRVLSGNAFGYVAAEAAYSGGREWFDEVKEIIYRNYLFVKDAFAEELPEVIVSPLEGTYLCWIDMKAYVKPKEMKDFMQKKCRLALDYGDWFGGERFASFVRMNLATSRENVETAVKAIIAGCR